MCVALVKMKASDPVMKDSKKKGSELTVSTNVSTLKAKPPFTFKARKLCVSLYAPLITSVKKSNGEMVKATGTPKGKTVVEFTVDLEKYITKPAPVDADDSSDISSLKVSF